MTNVNKPIGKAPYNFVPLPEKIVTRYDSIADLPTHNASHKEDANLLSGEITFEIVAENPILVADGNDDQNRRKFVQNADGTYEIPGSSLRGLIRNIVSVLSLSDWTEQIDDERFFYRSVAESSSTIGKHYKHVLNVSTKKINHKQESIPQNVKAGYIAKKKDGNYCIYHAKTDGGRLEKTYYKVNSGNIGINKDKFTRNVKRGFLIEEATFSVNKNGKVVKLYHDDANFKGYILYSGFIKTGRTEKVSAYLINEIDQEKEPVPVRLEDIKAYQADLNFRISKFPKRDRERMKKFFELPDKPGIEHAKPCFYLEYDGVTYFGFTAFLRLLYPYSTKDLLPDHILNKKSGIDYTSALFGFTKNSNPKINANYASRVHVHPALMKEDGEPDKPVKVILGSPRASATTMYLTQDHNADKNDYQTYLTKDATIRGMKQYWIKDEDMPSVDDKNNSALTELEALPKHTTFEAKISFDQLHEDELGLLLWALKRPEYHQIGSGKPYGYGVVTFKEITCHVTKNKNMYKSIEQFFDLRYERIDIDYYISIYHQYIKENYHLDIETLPSVQSFLKMKEKSKLPEEEMQYMNLQEYNQKPTLPTIDELVNEKVRSNIKEYMMQNKRNRKKFKKYPNRKKSYRQKL